MSYEPKYWICSTDDEEQIVDSVIKLVDRSVGAAVKEYVKDGNLWVAYPEKGQPKKPMIEFYTGGDVGADISFKAPLEDILLDYLEDSTADGTLPSEDHKLAIAPMIKVLDRAIKAFKAVRIAEDTTALKKSHHS